jgi:hypothetical protein
MGGGQRRWSRWQVTAPHRFQPIRLRRKAVAMPLMSKPTIKARPRGSSRGLVAEANSDFL